MLSRKRIDDHNKGKVGNLIILGQNHKQKEENLLPESCILSIFTTCLFPIFLFKECLKIIILSSIKRNILWRMSDNSNINPTSSNSGNRMHNN